jgi:hypothetical protein
MAKMRTRLFSVLALLLMAACATSRQGDSSPQAQGATLRVENQAWMDMTIYVVETGSGSRRRLGMVGATSGTNMRIPESVVGTGRALRFVADPIGNQQTASSFEMYVRPGQRVTITIPPGVGRR